jgi:hypothetical protein
MKQLDVLIRKFYALSVIAHVAHINTRSFSQHEALGEFYGGVNDFKDRLIEYLVGTGKINKVNAAMLETGGDVIKEAESLAELFCEVAESIDDEALINMSGEFEEAVGKLKYLFLLS